MACGCFSLHVASSSFIFTVSEHASLSESFSLTHSQSNAKQFFGSGFVRFGPESCCCSLRNGGGPSKTVVLLFKRFGTVERDGCPSVFLRTAAFQPCLSLWIPVSMQYTYHPAFGLCRWPRPYFGCFFGLDVFVWFRA